MINSDFFPFQNLYLESKLQQAETTFQINFVFNGY